MIPHPTIEAMADQFWTAARVPDGFPRPIERAVARALPVEIVKLSEVTVGRVGDYLSRRGLPGPLPADGRDLMGCLFAFRGHALVFVCGADDPAEQRFTVAHDAAHFLLDYLRPREAVLRELGEGVRDVLDGRRPPTVAERAAAVLREVHLGPHLHVLPRRAGGPVDSPCDDPVLLEAEDRADALGVELVAPRRVVSTMLDRLAADYPRDRLLEVLGEYFGVPPYVLSPTLRRLRPDRPPTFLQQAAVALGVRISPRRATGERRRP